jgi:hypothetical protein
MREHRHLALIQDIVKSVTNSTCIVHLWKVKSHIGIVGNEIADVTAVAVSKGLTHSEDVKKKEYKHPSNQRDDMYWLSTEVEMENKAVEAMVAAAAMVGVEVDGEHCAGARA